MARRRTSPPRIPTYLPDGCMAMSEKKTLNRDSITATNGRKICRHGTLWELTWTKTGKLRADRRGPPKGRRNA